MSLTDIRDQIKTILATVDGVGVIHDYERWAADWGKFLELYKNTDGKINGWTITRTKTDEDCNTASHVTRIHHCTIRGVYGLKDEDASELIFQALIESICAAFRAKYRLNDIAANTEPVQVEVVENRMFGTVLCHYCELTVTAEEILAWS